MTKSKASTPGDQAAAREASQEITAALMERIEERISVLAARLAQGASDELLAFLRFSARFHRYSANNQLLLWLQAPGARFVAGFHDWKRLGRQVLKGARALRVLAPVRVRDQEAAPGPDGQPPSKLVGFRYVSVFADTDTAGEPLPDDRFMTVQGGDEGTRDLLKVLMRAAPVPVVWVDAPERRAHGWTDGGSITLNRPCCQAQPAHAVRVFFHEWAHVALHFQGAGVLAVSAPERKVRELEADAAAYVLCSVHGIEAAAQVADYLTTWGGAPDALRASLGRISCAVSRILRDLGGMHMEKAPGKRLAA